MLETRDVKKYVELAKSETITMIVLASLLDVYCLLVFIGVAPWPGPSVVFLGVFASAVILTKIRALQEINKNLKSLESK